MITFHRMPGGYVTVYGPAGGLIYRGASLARAALKAWLAMRAYNRERQQCV